MNVLILSAGTRNKVVQYFKKTLCGKVIASDASALTPALYDADEFYIVPRIDAPDYIDIILDICVKESVSAVFSLIDPELSLLAKNRSRFAVAGVTVIGSDHEICERCLDKWKMYQWLKGNGYNCAKSFIDKEEFHKAVENGEITYPVFVKPVRGSASININKVTTKEEVELLFKRDDNLMIQEFMDGVEYGADCYIDMISGEPVAIFTKEKIKMRAGETDKSVSVKDEKLFEIIKGFVKKAELKGIIDIDIFKCNDEYLISEVNPRFGGGYPHAYESGVNIPEMIVKNINGVVNEDVTGQYYEGIYMMKYSEVTIIRK